MSTRRVPLLGLALLALLAALPLATQAADAPAVDTSNGVNGITQAAVAKGVLNCAARINQVTQFLSAGLPFGAMLFALPGQPDQRVNSVSLEMTQKDGTPAYGSASFAPNQANGCGAVYEAVAYWPQACDVVAAKQFAGMSKVRQLQKSITMLAAKSGATVFLMPAGPAGCVSIKKELVL